MCKEIFKENYQIDENSNPSSSISRTPGFNLVPKNFLISITLLLTYLSSVLSYISIFNPFLNYISII